MNNIPVGSLFETLRCGEISVLSDDGWDNVVVKFLETGFVTNTRRDKVISGSINDKLFRSAYGVGFIGVGNRGSTGCDAVAHKTWSHMIERCYSKKYHEVQPTYRDCTVCDEWHNFQSFAKWFDANYIKGFHLDKDIKIEGNKVYSPSACSFVSQSVNNEKAFKRTYNFKSPSGGHVVVYGITEFCYKNSLDRNSMSRVHNNKQAHHRGWTKA